MGELTREERAKPVQLNERSDFSDGPTELFLIYYKEGGLVNGNGSHYRAPRIVLIEGEQAALEEYVRLKRLYCESMRMMRASWKDVLPFGS